MSSAVLIVVSTCAFIQTQQERSLNLIEQALRRKSESAELVIVGCLPKIDSDSIGNFGNIMMISPREMEKLDDLINPEVKINDVEDSGPVGDIPRIRRDSLVRRFRRKAEFSRNFLSLMLTDLSSRWRSRSARSSEGKSEYLIRIANGCAGSCSYCAIKFAIGRLESRPAERIIREIKTGLEKGFSIFRLVAEDTGAYGIDWGSSIIELLSEIFGIEGEFNIRLNSFNPQWLIKYRDELLPVMLSHSDRIQRFRVPVQSGSDRILRMMRRPYEIEEVAAVLQEFTRHMPEMKLDTTLIVGFPGESQEDFDMSVKFIEEINFSNIFVNGYSDRPNTEASRSQDKLPPKIIRKRINVLRSLIVKKKNRPSVAESS